MMKTSAIKTWYLIHKWTSLVSMVFLLMLSITGLPLIFHHEIDHALGYSVDPPEMPGVSREASLDRMIADAKKRKPGDEMQFVVADPDEPNVWFIRLGETVDGAISAFYTYDARTGEFLNDYPLGEGIMNVFLRLHVDMFTGLPGTLFLGFMGLLLVASLISGVVLYAPFMQKLPFGTVRRERSSRLKWLDIHNVIGIVTFIWLLVVGVTGVINTLAIPIFERWQSTQLADMTKEYQDLPSVEETVSVDSALAAASSAEPNKQLSFMAFPGNSFASPHHFVAFMQGTTAWTSKLLKPVLIDAQNGNVVDSRELPWYVKMLLVSQPLHFGDYGGIPLKILWALLDILSIVLLYSGLYLWIKRRNRSFEEWLQKQKIKIGNGRGTENNLEEQKLKREEAI